MIWEIQQRYCYCYNATADWKWKMESSENLSVISGTTKSVPFIKKHYQSSYSTAIVNIILHCRKQILFCITVSTSFTQYLIPLSIIYFHCYSIEDKTYQPNFYKTATKTMYIQIQGLNKSGHRYWISAVRTERNKATSQILFSLDVFINIYLPLCCLPLRKQPSRCCTS